MSVTGRPLPTVRWWRDAMLVDATDEVYAHPGTVKHNQLIVPQLRRSDLHAVYTCQASNNNISQPVHASVTIEMHCEYHLSCNLLAHVPFQNGPIHDIFNINHLSVTGRAVGLPVIS